MRKRILITNDDGIHAHGIIRLARAAAKFGEVWVIAPGEERSAASHSITLRTYIEVEEREFPVEGVHAFATTGMPADCIRVGVLGVMPYKPDIVFSGINFGYNAGTDVQYSATVGAAMEAVFQGIPAVAFSEGFGDDHLLTDEHLEEVIAEVIDTPYVWGQIVNVNFPLCKPEEYRGILRDRVVSRGCVFKDSYTCEEVGTGKKRYQVKGEHKTEFEEGSDLRALFDHYISIGTVRNIQ